MGLSNFWQSYFLCVNVDNMIVFFRYNANSSFVRFEGRYTICYIYIR